MTGLAVKRIYDPASAEDGTRMLVDRLWPRGIAKARARVDMWLRDIAPSDALRKRFHGTGEDWETFRTEYYAELRGAAAQAAARTVFECLERGRVTLLYAARDEEQNNAVALKAWLERRAKRR